MVTLYDVKVALDLPVTGSDREVAEAMAARGGFDRPSEEVTIRFFIAVLDALVSTIISEPEGFLWEDAFLSYEAFMVAISLKPFSENEVRERISRDLGIPEDRGISDVQEYMARECYELGGAGLIDLVR